MWVDLHMLILTLYLIHRWEGFAHVALHNWNQNQKQSSSTSCDSLCGSLNAISVILMRVAIKLIGDSDPTFRKACLVGAISLLSDSEGWLDLNQRSIFSHLIKSIDAKSSFSDALRNVMMSLQENEDPLQQIRWLQHLGNDEQVIEVQEWSIPSIEQLQHLILFCHDHKDEAEAAFMEVKCKFCSEAVFEDVEKCYKILLGKYRKVRKQYTSGMLSLHCNWQILVHRWPLTSTSFYMYFQVLLTTWVHLAWPMFPSNTSRTVYIIMTTVALVG